MCRNLLVVRMFKDGEEEEVVEESTKEAFLFWFEIASKEVSAFAGPVEHGIWSF